MARTIIEGRSVLIAGIDSAPGRAAAQQLSRAGCRVVLGGRDETKLENLEQQLIKKGGEPTPLFLTGDPDDWVQDIRDARDRVGHIHMVLNALALCYAEPGEADAAAEEAIVFDKVAAGLLVGHGPLKMLTLWPENRPLPPIADPTAWHGYLLLGPHQRLDTQDVSHLDATGALHLRAGALADAVVALFQVPPSIRPATIRLECIPSSEKATDKTQA